MSWPSELSRTRTGKSRHAYYHAGRTKNKPHRNTKAAPSPMLACGYCFARYSVTASGIIDRRNVSLGTPVSVTIARQLKPSLLSLRTWATSTATMGRPNFTPRLLAARCPATTRSRIILRSSSATAPSTVNTMRPAGVVVSIASVTDTKSMPRDENSSSARSRWLVLRANLSNRKYGNDRKLPAPGIGHEPI